MKNCDYVCLAPCFSNAAGLNAAEVCSSPRRLVPRRSIFGLKCERYICWKYVSFGNLVVFACRGSEPRGGLSESAAFGPAALQISENCWTAYKERRSEGVCWSGSCGVGELKVEQERRVALVFKGSLLSRATSSVLLAVHDCSVRSDRLGPSASWDSGGKVRVGRERWGGQGHER